MLRATLILVAIIGLSSDLVGQSPQPELCPKRMVGLKYPRLAHLAGTQGKIELEATISSEGTVKQTHAISGPPLLSGDMAHRLREWRFSGCSANASACRYRVTFVFEMMTGVCSLPECPNEVEIDLPVIT